MSANPAPSGPPALPFLGHLPQFWRDPLGFLVRCAAEYGDVVSLRIGRPTLLLTNPDDIRHVLVTHAGRYSKTPRISGPSGRRRLGNSVLSSSGSEHLKQRRAMQPLMHSKALDVFAGAITHAVDEWMSDRSDGSRLDIAEHMQALARRIMTTVLLGSDAEDADGTVAQAVRTRRRYHEHVVGAALPQYRPSRIAFQYRKARKILDALLAEAIQLRRTSTRHFDDMLSRWIQIRYVDDTAMTDEQIHAEALTFIDTGYETISAALTWTWYLLARHPHVETRLASEMRDVLGGRLPYAEDVPKLRYTAAVLKESLRLYPPAWNFARTALEPDVLPCGVEVLPGMKLFLCQYIVHRRRRYFVDPDEFKPERFSGEASSDRPRFSYFPFGGGPHACLGEAFAELESIVVLASLAQRFRFELEPGHTMKMDAGFALRPRHGMGMHVVAKNASC